MTVRLASWLLLVASGLGLGAGAAALQLRLLRYGTLTESQRTPFLVAFLALGVLACVGGGVLGGGLRRGWRGLLVRGILLPAVAMLVFVHVNRRPLPDVYLLVTDATRADHLSLYGYDRETTPFLEELAERSIVFENAISQGTHTIVSTPSILASAYPSEHGMQDYRDVLDERFKLISEHLSEHGYSTYAYVTNPHLAPKHGFAQGFDRYEHNRSWKHTPAAGVNARLLAWMDERDRSPSFSFLFYIDPHNPYRPPEPWTRRFDPGWTGAPVTDWDHVRAPAESAELRNLVAQYDGAIAYWDSELRNLFDEIRRRRRFANALVIYTSDHGEEFWEHGFWGHNKTPYEGLVHVPLVISFPVPVRFPPLRRVSGTVEDVVSSVDVLPTVLEFLRIPPAGTVSGRSALASVYGGDRGPERVAYCEQILRQYGPYDIRGIRTEREKYIHIFHFEGEDRGEDLLFDLATDPGEQRNLAIADPERTRRFREMLDAHMERLARGGPVEAETRALDPAALERLRSLGYLGN